MIDKTHDLPVIRQAQLLDLYIPPAEAEDRYYLQLVQQAEPACT